MNQLILDAITPRHLGLTIMPTEACNFRCTYCYEDFKSGRMSDETVNGIKNLITQRAKDLDLLFISWFGGEPLLALGIIKEISEHALATLSDQTQFQASISTNAYLLNKEALTNLINWRVRQFQITLDGPEEWHNKSRVLANGRGTYKEVVESIKTMHESSHDFSTTIRIHVDTNNAAEIPNLLDCIANVTRGDRRFKTHIRQLSNLGGNVIDVSRILKSKSKNKIAELKELAEDLGLSLPSEGHQSEICYATKLNSFVIRSNGEINKCTVALNSEQNAIGRISSHDGMTIESKKIQFWARGLETLNPSELSCPMHT